MEFFKLFPLFWWFDLSMIFGDFRGWVESIPPPRSRKIQKGPGQLGLSVIYIDYLLTDFIWHHFFVPILEHSMKKGFLIKNRFSPIYDVMKVWILLIIPKNAIFALFYPFNLNIRDIYLAYFIGNVLNIILKTFFLLKNWFLPIYDVMKVWILQIFTVNYGKKLVSSLRYSNIYKWLYPILCKFIEESKNVSLKLKKIMLWAKITSQWRHFLIFLFKST